MKKRLIDILFVFCLFILTIQSNQAFAGDTKEINNVLGIDFQSGDFIFQNSNGYNSHSQSLEKDSDEINDKKENSEPKNHEIEINWEILYGKSKSGNHSSVPKGYSSTNGYIVKLNKKAINKSELKEGNGSRFIDRLMKFLYTLNIILRIMEIILSKLIKAKGGKKRDSSVLREV